MALVWQWVSAVPGTPCSCSKFHHGFPAPSFGFYGLSCPAVLLLHPCTSHPLALHCDGHLAEPGHSVRADNNVLLSQEKQGGRAGMVGSHPWCHTAVRTWAGCPHWGQAVTKWIPAQSRSINLLLQIICHHFQHIWAAHFHPHPSKALELGALKVPSEHHSLSVQVLCPMLGTVCCPQCPEVLVKDVPRAGHTLDVHWHSSKARRQIGKTLLSPTPAPRCFQAALGHPNPSQHPTSCWRPPLLPAWCSRSDRSSVGRWPQCPGPCDSVGWPQYCKGISLLSHTTVTSPGGPGGEHSCGRARGEEQGVGGWGCPS